MKGAKNSKVELEKCCDGLDGDECANLYNPEVELFPCMDCGVAYQCTMCCGEFAAQCWECARKTIAKLKLEELRVVKEVRVQFDKRYPAASKFVSVQSALEKADEDKSQSDDVSVEAEKIRDGGGKEEGAAAAVLPSGVDPEKKVGVVTEVMTTPGEGPEKVGNVVAEAVTTPGVDPEEKKEEIGAEAPVSPEKEIGAEAPVSPDVEKEVLDIVADGAVVKKEEVQEKKENFARGPIKLVVLSPKELLAYLRGCQEFAIENVVDPRMFWMMDTYPMKGRMEMQAAMDVSGERFHMGFAHCDAACVESARSRAQEIAARIAKEMMRAAPMGRKQKGAYAAVKYALCIVPWITAVYIESSLKVLALGKEDWQATVAFGKTGVLRGVEQTRQHQVCARGDEISKGGVVSRMPADAIDLLVQYREICEMGNFDAPQVEEESSNDDDLESNSDEPLSEQKVRKVVRKIREDKRAARRKRQRVVESTLFIPPKKEFSEEKQGPAKRVRVDRKATPEQRAESDEVLRVGLTEEEKELGYLIVYTAGGQSRVPGQKKLHYYGECQYLHNAGLAKKMLGSEAADEAVFVQCGPCANKKNPIVV
jgi:hypothetical protein